MCIDYTDLNKHCLKDPFPLPRIDQVVDSTAGSVLLCFLDCYSGYHQIALHPDDEDKTVVITPHGIYCYKWIEVQPVVKVTSKEAVKFIGDIKHRFGVPNRSITDPGAAFTSSVFWDFCQDNTIDVYYSSVAHPWCNGQVERANGMVLQALKDCIYDDASNYATRWLAELPHVIWGLRTQVSC
jgi:hypothetical protein